MKHIADLLVKKRLPKKGSERGELIKYFSEVLERPIRMIGVRLAHYSTQDLYGLKSAYKDRLARNGAIPAVKYLWVITKTINL